MTNLLLILLIGTGAGLLWWGWRRRQREQRRIQRRRNGGLRGPTPEPAPETAPDAGVGPAARAASSKPSAAQAAFARHHEQFCDLFGTLWHAAHASEPPDSSSRQQALELWRARLEQVNDLTLLGAWRTVTALSPVPETEAAAQAVAAKWLGLLEEWGLTPYHPETVDINDHALRRFHVFPRQQSGTALVKSPCWSFDGLILQKGDAVVMPSSDA